MNILEKKEIKTNKKTKDKLPFAVFVCPKSNNDETEDYKQVFTDIISDRIKKNTDKKIRTKFRKKYCEIIKDMI